MKTLVLGGYGNFGTRICRALAHDPSIQLLVGGRNLHRAQALAAQLGGDAQGIAIDLEAPDLAQALHAAGVELLIHTAGPFQHQTYGVASAAAAAAAHYIDLADGRRFVCDFPAAMDEMFRDAHRCAISGASTVPALSSAVVDRLSRSWTRIDTIDICIAPAQTAPRGRATMEAVLSYCGELIKVWNRGRWQSERGWGHPERVRFARMRPRLGALCDVPDLEIFPNHYEVTQRVMFRAAVEIGLAQRAFAMLAAMRAARLLRKPARLAGLLERAADTMNFMGTSTGGMVVQVAGRDASNKAVARAWHITAGDDHGPEIPCMAAILLARQLASGVDMPTGASTCTSRLQLADFEPEFARWGMLIDITEEISDRGASPP